MPKYLTKRVGIWWLDKTYKGRRYRHSLETTSLREAQKRLEAKLAELTATHWGEKPRRTFDETAERFVDEHIPTLKPKSQKRYMVSLGQLAPVFEGKKLDEISSGLLYEFEQTRYRAGASKPTIRRDLACLSSVLGFAIMLEWIGQNPVPAYMKARSKKGLKESEPKTRNLDHNEEAAILKACNYLARNPSKFTSRKAGAPKYWIDFGEAVAFAIDTGIRKEEQFSLMRRHIDFARGELIIDAEIAKNSKARRIPLLPRALAIAKRRVKDLSSPYLFPASDGQRYSEKSNYMLKKLRLAAEAAKIAPIIWHDLRRTCGCRLLQDHEMPIERVSRWLGHSSIKVTEKHYAFLRVEDLHNSIKDSAGKADNVMPIKGDEQHS